MQSLTVRYTDDSIFHLFTVTFVNVPCMDHPIASVEINPRLLGQVRRLGLSYNGSIHSSLPTKAAATVTLRFSTPFVVHLGKMYIHLRQQLKLYGKYTFISTSMNFIEENELSITLFAYVLTFNSING